jgi:hypothetical protein
MWITLLLIALGLLLGVQIRNRLGAAFLTFSAVTIVHVMLETGPQLIDQSAYGRRVAAGLRLMTHGGAGSLTNLILAAYGGLCIAYLFSVVSEDRRTRNWDPEARVRRRRRSGGGRLAQPDLGVGSGRPL